MPFIKRLFSSPPPPALDVGAKFCSSSAYRLLALLGRGGMGEVWKAERTSAGGHTQTVALKFLVEPESCDAALKAEALRMSRLSHDNIVQYLDSGVDEAGRTFVAMTFVEGLDLDGLRAQCRIDAPSIRDGKTTHRIPDRIVGFIAFMTLRALDHAHTFDFGDGVIGLVHRDVSPGNILLDAKRGFVKLSDFGVAAAVSDAARAGQITGKVPFMAPEALLAEPFDARSDLYALGVVLYELLTGFNPNLRPESSHSVIGAISEVMLSLDKPLRAPHEVVAGIDEALSSIVVKLLSRAPEGRYPSAAAAMEAFSAYLFNAGYGPTTTSLADYLRILESPARSVSPSECPSLRFLGCTGGALDIRPPWTPTDAARAALENGQNPARIDP